MGRRAKLSSNLGVPNLWGTYTFHFSPWILEEPLPTSSKAEGVFTLGVRDSSVESPNIMVVIQDLNLLTMKKKEY